MKVRVLIVSLICVGFAAPAFGDPTDFTSEWSFTTGAPVSVLGPGTLVGVGTDGDGASSVGGLDAMYFGLHTGVEIGYELRVNTPTHPEQFTMIWDLFIDADNPDWGLGLFNGNATNSNDADLFLVLGNGGYWYDNGDGTPWLKGQWNRFVYVNDYANGTSTMYVNGAHSATFAPADYIYSGETYPAWLLTDDNGETTYGHILNFAFTDELLTADDAAALGGVDAAGIGIPEPVTIALLGLGGLGVLRRRRR